VSLQAMGPSIELRYQVKWFAIFVANITSIMPFATSNPSFQIRADLNLKAWFLNFLIGLLGFLMVSQFCPAVLSGAKAISGGLYSWGLQGQQLC